MSSEQTITETQARFERGALWRGILFFLYYLALLIGILVLIAVVYSFYLFNQTYGITYLDDNEKHFKYGSIGAEMANGLPYRLFIALPEIFPEEFGARGDYSHFGFIYEDSIRAPDKNLPIGFAKGYRNSIEVAWFNCAICHTGKVTVQGPSAGLSEEKIVLGMPANTVDLERFFVSLFRMVEDKDFSWESKKFRDAINNAGERRLNLFERFAWEWLVLPNTRNVLLDRRNRLLPLLDPSKTDPQIKNNPERFKCGPSKLETDNRYARRCERYANDITLKPVKTYTAYIPETVPNWGPGRVDTFNPYKLINFNLDAHCLTKEERIGVSDFPTIYWQKPRGDQMMHLHWDGNNSSLSERNLSAAIGAGVTEYTVNHKSLAVISAWLDTLRPQISPYKKSLDKETLSRGQEVYMRECADCHGYQGKDDYIFKGARLGQIEPIDYIATDPHRLYSYTSQMEEYQKERLFCARKNKRHRFANFKKTNGYANQPLDALWLRAPYLHNGSVPTLADLLKPSEERPKTFTRGQTRLDPVKGGFKTSACSPDTNEEYALTGEGFCFDTSLPGNGNAGHEYGTYLSDEEKRDLLTYLLSF